MQATPPQLPMASLTLQDLYAFHLTERKIFYKLVIKLGRCPGQSLLVMALWLCFEQLNLPSLTVKMLGLCLGLVNELADEAQRCLDCLDNKKPPSPREAMPLTSKLLQKRISPLSIFSTKYTMIIAIKDFLNSICAHIFTDILQAAIPGTAKLRPKQQLYVPGFPHQTFGYINIIIRPLNYCPPCGELWSLSNPIGTQSHADDRTMFLTFSRGFKVTEAEVRELFTALYGDCVEAIKLEAGSSPCPADQSLYARMVLRSVVSVDRILNQGNIAKYQINGKHVWARKFERRDPSEKTSSPSSSSSSSP